MNFNQQRTYKRKLSVLDSEQLLELQRFLTLEYINKLQKEYDVSMYETKSPSDKLVCQLCNGKYTRRNKKSHEKTEKHKKKLSEFLD